MLLNLLQAAFALLVTLGLVFAAAWAVRRWAPAGLLALRPQSGRRLELVESLTLDPHRRLVLVRIDGGERLILLGDGAFAADTTTKS